MGWTLIVVGGLLVFVTILGLLSGFPLVRANAVLLVAGIMMILAGGTVVSEHKNGDGRVRRER